MSDAVLDLHRGNNTSREHWRNVCAAILSTQPMEAIHAMSAAGFDEFERIATLKYRGHGFNADDYRYMFAVIQKCAKDNRRVDPRLILGTNNPLTSPGNKGLLGPDGRPVKYH